MRADGGRSCELIYQRETRQWVSKRADERHHRGGGVVGTRRLVRRQRTLPSGEKATQVSPPAMTLFQDLV